MGKELDVLLISPPFWLSLDMPNMALPILSAELIENDLNCDVLDLNAILINELLTKYKRKDINSLMELFLQIIKCAKKCDINIVDIYQVALFIG